MMGSRLSALLYFVTGCSMAFSLSPAVKWVRGYTFGSAESHPHAGVQTSDGGFLMVGDGIDYANQTVVRRHIFVLKTSADGTLQWQNRFGDCGDNYGKFGIELSDGTLLIAGAKCVQQAQGVESLNRVLYRLDADGSLLNEQVFPNQRASEGRKDGFMCVALSTEGSTVIATGFIGGENSTAGYQDEPMFLIYGGSAFVMKLKYTEPSSPLTVVFDHKLNASRFEPSQGTRVLHDPQADAYVISVASSDQPHNFQFGMAAVSTAGEVNWLHMFVAEHGVYTGHASHPYALTLSSDRSGYVIGGLAVDYDSHGIEQCKGRLAKIAPDGQMVWDSRFVADEADANIECYGVQSTPDGGYIVTCGTGVEPELHPHDSAQQKTWRALVRRTDPDGAMVWQSLFWDESREKLQNNAGEYIITTDAGEYAVYLDSQSYGSSSTGGNFGLLLLGSDTNTSYF